MQSTTVCKEQSSVLKQMMFFHKLDSLFFFFLMICYKTDTEQCGDGGNLSL